MHAELESSGWVELLSRPRKFLSGDPVPDEVPDRISAVSVAILMSVVGHLIPVPFTGPTSMAIASTMLVPGSTTKRSAMRWMFDNLIFRHVFVDGKTEDQAQDDLLVRLEVQTFASQWLPLMSFRLRHSEFELGTTEPIMAPSELPVGAVVTLKNLRGRLVPELNGERATVRAFDADGFDGQGIYEVALAGSGEVLRLKREHLRASADDASVRPTVGCIRFTTTQRPPSGSADTSALAKTKSAMLAVGTAVMNPLAKPTPQTEVTSVPVIEDCFWRDEAEPSILHRRIRVLVDGVVTSEVERTEQVMDDGELAPEVERTEQVVDDPPGQNTVEL